MIAVVLAAGRGARLGDVAKALLVAEGATFLERVAGAARAGGVDEILVVVGPPHGARVAAEAERLRLAVVENPQPERGMASSVATGFAAARLSSGAPAALLWPVDCARVAADTVARVAAAAAPDRIVIPTWQEQGGHPAAFGRDVWDELVGCAALPEGARTVVHRDPTRVLRLPVGDPAVLADVDVPADLEPAP